MVSQKNPEIQTTTMQSSQYHAVGDISSKLIVKRNRRENESQQNRTLLGHNLLSGPADRTSKDSILGTHDDLPPQWHYQREDSKDNATLKPHPAEPASFFPKLGVEANNPIN
jgi:hypothetical protein